MRIPGRGLDFPRARHAPDHQQSFPLMTTLGWRTSGASRDGGAACKSDAASRIASTVARVGHGQFRRQRALFERVDRSPTSLPSTLTFRPTPGGVRAGIAIPRRVFGLLRAPLECRGTPTVGRGVLPAPPASSARGVVSSSRAADRTAQAGRGSWGRCGLRTCRALRASSVARPISVGTTMIIPWNSRDSVGLWSESASRCSATRSRALAFCMAPWGVRTSP